MRRLRQIAAVLLVLLLIDFANVPIPYVFDESHGQVRAQNTTPSLFGLVGPAGMVWYSAASQVVSNTTAQTALISTVIPASMFATSAASNFQSVNLGPANASTPLHLRMLGLLSTTSSPGVVNLGVNFGVGTVAASAFGPATVTLLNAQAPGASQSFQPITIDVWLNPIATGTATNATPNIVNTVFMTTRVELQQAAGSVAQGTAGATPATYAVYNAATIARVNIASAHILNVNWNFGSAGQTLFIFRTTIRQID